MIVLSIMFCFLLPQDLFSAHDFEVDINIDAPLAPAAPVSVTPATASALKSGPKRSLNLDDYKKRRGLI